MTEPHTSSPRPENTASFGFRDVPRGEKAGLVRGVFDSVASSYDVMNDLMSLGVHRAWKDMTIIRANPQPGEHLVDIAGGTGDLARAFIRRGTRVAHRRGGVPPTATVCDINGEMVRAGRNKNRREDAHISWLVGNGEQLPLPDNHADCITIAFGIRNVTDRAAALADIKRVLKPGGRFLCLEFSHPTSSALQRVYDLWSFNAIPAIGQLVAKDRDSYQYLVESIRKFPNPTDFAAEVTAAGFSRVSVTNYSGGIAALHMGWG